jgi:hypothetical protein
MTRIFLSIVLLIFSASVFAQSTSDVTLKNSERQQILASGIKSKSIWEYRYVKGTDNAFQDSGYKSFYFGYDDKGRITEYTKYHVFTDLTVKEFYQYGKTDNISKTTRYNSKNDIIEAILYKYNKQGKLRQQIHEAYYNSVRVGVYFSILASVNELPVFALLQDELAIEPRLESYTIVINIRDTDEQNQYVVIGDENDATSLRYSWNQLSMDTQQKLLAYAGPNRKEHQYISKFISRVEYKYDKSGNMTSRVVFNTSNDQTGKETWRYDAAGRKTGYNKYNESGKLTGSESYTYDAGGRLIESLGIETGGSFSGRLVLSYDEAGNPAVRQWFNGLGELNGTYKFIYDTYGRLLEEIKLRGESEVESRSVYEYDENGNVTQVIRFDIDGNKERLQKYYYDHY